MIHLQDEHEPFVVVAVVDEVVEVAIEVKEEQTRLMLMKKVEAEEAEVRKVEVKEEKKEKMMMTWKTLDKTKKKS